MMHAEKTAGPGRPVHGLEATATGLGKECETNLVNFEEERKKSTRSSVRNQQQRQRRQQPPLPWWIRTPPPRTCNDRKLAATPSLLPSFLPTN